MRGKCPKDKGGTVPFAKRGGRGSEATAGGARGGRGISRPPPALSQKSQHSDELAEICRRHHVKRLEVFASAAVGNFNPDTSDTDFLVNYHPFLHGGKPDAYFGFLEDLLQLVNRPVDLVIDSVIENPHFRKQA